MAISTRFQGHAPPESSRTEKAKQSESTLSSSKSTGNGAKRNHADQRDTETSDSDSDSPPPLPKRKKKPQTVGKSKERGHGRKVVVDEVIDVDNTDDAAGGEAEGDKGEVELSGSEEVAAAPAMKRAKGKQRATSDEKGSDAGVPFHAQFPICQY